MNGDEEWKIPIYRFYIEADKDGPLKGQKKFLHSLAGSFVLLDAGSWYLWLLVKAQGRKLLAFILGIGNRQPQDD